MGLVAHSRSWRGSPRSMQVGAVPSKREPSKQASRHQIQHRRPCSRASRSWRRLLLPYQLGRRSRRLRRGLRSPLRVERHPDSDAVTVPSLLTAFDLQYLAGRDPTHLPLRERRLRLEESWSPAGTACSRCGGSRPTGWRLGSRCWGVATRATSPRTRQGRTSAAGRGPG
jgi:hypothetical protein